MKTIDQIRVSFYENVYSKSPSELSLYLVLEAIIKGKYADRINTIRRFHAEGDKQAASQLKSKLPCFTASGVFDGPHAARFLQEHSCIILLDYDGPADLPQLLAACANDLHTVAAFRSPTDGLKVAAFVENAAGRHREAFRLVSEYYNRLTGVECDRACKDESRLCYMSYDPDAYVAPFYESFVLPENVHPAHPPLEEAGEGSVTRFVLSYLFLNPSEKGNRNFNLFKLACSACKRGYAENDIYSETCLLLKDSDFTESEIKATISNGYQKVNSEKDASGLQSASDTEKDKRTKSQYNTPVSDDTDDDEYWRGEELRKKTPYIPNSVYKNIPKFLRECQLEDNSLRERDVLLLSSLTAFSAIMPQTSGIYNHRLFTPHLYTLCLAPAGSGKGTAQWGEKLLHTVNARILRESEILQDKYKEDFQAWQEARNRRKKDENAEPVKEPKEPPFKCLVIPATTSNTRMQMQLRDNGSLGAIIFDTEAQTLSNATKLDCGHLDDMFCKAFGHETISSSYKSNGMRPIVIRRPSLAMFLTGTPEQLALFLMNPGNGLPSRFLFYTFREPPVWKEMGTNEYDMDEYFDHYSETAYRLYLFCKEHPLRFSFTHGQWQRLNMIYSRLLFEVVSENDDDLQAVVKRYAFITMRIAMILGRIEKFEQHDTRLEYVCSDTFFETALSIVLCCYEHSRLLLTSLPHQQRYALKDPDEKRHFFDELPEKFTTEDVQNLTADYSFSFKTAMRYIGQLIKLKVNKLGHGKYEKL